MNRKLSILVAFMVMMITGTSITLATDFVPPPNTSSAEGTANQCTIEGGSTGFVFDGMLGPQLNQFSDPDTSITMDFWWRGDDVNPDSPEWHTYFPAGAYENLRPDILNGTYWTYQGCTEDQVLQQFTDHVRAREADPSVNTKRDGESVVIWQETQLFVAFEGDAYVAPAADSTMDSPVVSDPANNSGVITSGGFDDEDYSDSETSDDFGQGSLEESYLTDTALGTPDEDLCADEFADELSDTLGVERNNRDYCNENAGVEDRCVIGYLRGPLDRLPELSSSGAGNIFTVDRKNGTAISWFPHGRATFQPGPTGKRFEAGIFCTYDQIMGWINQNMSRLGASQYVDWQDLGFMSLDTYNIPGGYYGGTEDPDTAKDCRPLGEDRIFEQIRKGYIDARGYHVHGSPWVSGVSKERQVVIPARDTANGDLYWDSNVQGAVRLYPADRCSFEEVMEQARVHHNARGKAHSALVVKNWRTDAYTSQWFSIR